MTARVIDGRKIASDIERNLKKETSELKIRGIRPCLAVIFDGADALSERHAALKEKAGNAVGVKTFLFNIRELTTQRELIQFIDKLNSAPEIHGILLQYPLEGFDEKEAVNKIASEKDIDGSSHSALNKLLLEEPYFIPCTAYGIIKMLEAYGVSLDGKHAVIVENSQIGNNGKFLSFLFAKKNATVSTCFSTTPNLKKECLRADIVCVAAGRPQMITADMIKNGAIVIDMGMNATSNGKIVGDVDFNSVKEKSAYITPVPGCIGPMTVAMIMYNTVLAAKMKGKMKKHYFEYEL
jgi:methylenetetrahydrofolate dehydrogenase (NADP+)/methenyltetrahydrofolate cyclohydrolase